jgi:DNA-binding IclR family transcriptional regulator
MLGPRFIEFDRTIRLTDPLLQIAPPIIKEIRDSVGGAIAVCGFYGDRVLAVLQDVLDMEIPLQMERGRSFSLFFGSPSRIIVAYLPPYRLRNLLLHYPREIAAAGLGETWPEFKKKLKDIRRAGYSISSQLNPHVVGIAAPIFRAPSEVTASICLVRSKRKIKEDDISFLTELAVNVADRISKDLQSYVPSREQEIPFNIYPA